jgi:DNA-binding CsgD family transcriptional regulator
MFREEGLAGRRAELERVSRTLSGLSDRPFLLVLGEAGIGKSRLLRAAESDIGDDDQIVLSGWCLPTAANMPLLPVVDVLRAANGIEGGHWLTNAIAECPRYVAEAIAPVLPEILTTDGFDPSTESEDPWWRQRLFTSLRALFEALARRRRTCVVIEDVHWADRSTLDLLEYLITPRRMASVSAVFTVRTDDPQVSEESAEWLRRAKRSPVIDVLNLGPLSEEETAEQIELLTGQKPARSVIAAIFRRSGGNALFTEELVRDEPGGVAVHGVLPADLADAFEVTIRGLSPHGRTVARALATAARPLDDGRILKVTQMTVDELSSALRELRAMRLIRATDNGTEMDLRHALLGEAVLAEMLPHERADFHGRYARSLEGSAGADVAAEIAEHWRLASNYDEELTWTVRAAQAAESLYAAKEAASHWLRAIELWDMCHGPEQLAGLDLPEIYTAGIEALNHSGEGERAGALAEAALVALASADPAVTAEVHRQLGKWRGVESPELGLENLRRAIELYERWPPSTGLLKAYDNSAALWRSQGNFAASAALLHRALDVCTQVHDPAMHMRFLALLAWHDMLTANHESSHRRMDEAWAIAASRTDPRGDVFLSLVHTNILLATCASAAEVERAAAPGLHAIASFALDNEFPTSLLRFNLCHVFINAGDVERAGAMASSFDGPARRDIWADLLTRAELDMLHGELVSARQRFDKLAELTITAIGNRIEIGVRLAELELWLGQPAAAWNRTNDLLNVAAATDDSGYMGATLVLAARAAADVRELQPGRPTQTQTAAAEAKLDELHSALKYDPFVRRVPADCRAERASWDAERGRLCGEPVASAWERAASEWDALQRPHRAAYNRWRQAEALLARPNTRNDAAEVLRRAAGQAHQHAPLTAAIQALAKRARVELTARAQTAAEPPRRSDRFDLTNREFEVLRLVGEGKSNSEIGKALFISPKTVSAHVTSILRKFNVSTRAHAATLAARHGLIE